MPNDYPKGRKATGVGPSVVGEIPLNRNAEGLPCGGREIVSSAQRCAAACPDRAGQAGWKSRSQPKTTSADIFLGVPFNIASYALLTLMVAQVCNLKPGEFVWTGGDCHVYHNHFEQVRKQLAREPRALPTMHLNPEVTDIFAFRYADFRLEGYDPHPGIKGAVAV